MAGDSWLSSNFLSINGISINDGERVGCKKDDGTIRFGHYDRVLGSIIWEDDLTHSVTDHAIMIEISRWLEER